MTSLSRPAIGVRSPIPNCDEKGAVRGVEDVSTSSGAEREPYGGVACLWALEDQLLGGLLRRLLVVGQWPDGGG
jgi:hypothetical protein